MKIKLTSLWDKRCSTRKQSTGPFENQYSERPQSAPVQTVHSSANHPNSISPPKSQENGIPVEVSEPLQLLRTTRCSNGRVSSHTGRNAQWTVWALWWSNGICLLSSSADSQTTGINSEYQKVIQRDWSWCASTGKVEYYGWPKCYITLHYSNHFKIWFLEAVLIKCLVCKTPWHANIYPRWSTPDTALQDNRLLSM